MTDVKISEGRAVIVRGTRYVCVKVRPHYAVELRKIKEVFA